MVVIVLDTHLCVIVVRCGENEQVLKVKAYKYTASFYIHQPAENTTGALAILQARARFYSVKHIFPFSHNPWQMHMLWMHAMLAPWQIIILRFQVLFLPWRALYQRRQHNSGVY